MCLTVRTLRDELDLILEENGDLPVATYPTFAKLHRDDGFPQYEQIDSPLVERLIPANGAGPYPTWWDNFDGGNTNDTEPVVIIQ